METFLWLHYSILRNRKFKMELRKNLGCAYEKFQVFLYKTATRAKLLLPSSRKLVYVTSFSLQRNVPKPKYIVSDLDLAPINCIRAICVCTLGWSFKKGLGRFDSPRARNVIVKRKIS